MLLRQSVRFGLRPSHVPAAVPGTRQSFLIGDNTLAKAQTLLREGFAETFRRDFDLVGFA